MQLTLAIDGIDHTHRTVIDSLMIEQDIDGRVSVASVELHDTTGLVPSDVALKDFEIGDAGPIVGNAIVSNNTLVGPGDLVFAGQVARLTRVFPDPSIERWKLDATGWEYLLDTVTFSDSWTNESDKDILADAFANYLPAIDTSQVEELELNLDVEAENWTLRELVDFLAGLSGARWFVTPDKELLYYQNASAPAAPFDIDTDTPDNTTSFSVPITRGEEDYSKVFNRVTVLGALSGSARLSHTAEDVYSQATWGIRERTIVDDGLKTATQVQLRAEAEVLAAAQPRQTGTFVIWRDGLQRGQRVRVDSTALGYADEYILRRASITAQDIYTLRYEFEFGEFNTRLDNLIRRLERLARTRTETPFALPPAGSVDAAALANEAIDRLSVLANKLRPIPVFSTPPALPSVDFPTGSFYYDLSDDEFYENVGGVWTLVSEGTAVAGKLQFLVVGRVQVNNLIGLIQAGQIDTLNVNQLDGQITGSQIAALTITNANIAALTITGGQIANSTIGSAKIADLEVSKLTAGVANFASTATFNRGNAQLQLDAGAVILRSGLDQELFLTSTNVTLRNATHSVVLTSSGVVLTGGGNTATLTSSNLTFTAGSANTVISSAGVQIYGGSTGIGIGASSFVASPLQIETSQIRLAIGGSEVRVNSLGLQVFVGNIDAILGNITAAGGRVTASAGGTSVRLQPGFVPSVEINSVKVLGVQGAAVANATGSGDAHTQLNVLLDRLRAHGLIAT